MIPLGVADARVSGWPVVTFALAGASLLLTVLVWLAPDATVDRAQAEVRAYASAHGSEQTPEGCLPHVAGSEGTGVATQPASAEFERRCNAATEASYGGHEKRFALQPVGRQTPGLAWVLHPLAWTNPFGALTGLLLLVLVVGSFVEDRYGKGPFAAALAAAALLSALVWRMAAGEASDAWSGGQGYLAALLALFVATFVTRPVKFLLLTPLPKMIEVPAWSVAVWWLIARTVSLWLGDVDRPLVVAELVSFIAGGAAGAGLRLHSAGKLGLPPRRPARPSPTSRTNEHAPVEHAFAGLSARESQPIEAEPPSDPAADLPPPGPSAPAPDAAWAVIGPDPLAEPQIALRKRTVGHSDATAVATAPPSAAVQAATVLVPPVDPEPQLHVFDFSVPAAVDFAGQGTGFSTPLATSAAVAPAPVPASATALDSFDPLQAPAAFDFDALFAGLPPPPAGDSDTDVVAPPAAARQPETPPPLAARPSPYNESTVAYAPGRQPSPLVAPETLEDPAVPRVALAAAVDRAQDGVVLALVGDAWLRLGPAEVRAVAVGLVLHRDHPGATPEIWIDVVTDVGGRDQPARAVRLHPAREDLLRLLPDVAPSHAFATLAELLAAGGAFQLPQQPVWPGPPFPRYDTAAEFIRMWHRQLHG